MKLSFPHVDYPSLINPEVGKLGDLGTPIVESKPDHEISKIYLSLAEKIKSIYL